MGLKEILNIRQDIEENNIIINAFNYYFDERDNVYNLIIEMEIYDRGTIENNTLNSRLEFLNNPKNVISVRVLLKNITYFSLRDVSKKIQITGFEILNHKEEGWESEKKYEIRDFEEDKINLFCEEIILLE